VAAKAASEVWYSVKTPSVFLEFDLPMDSSMFSRANVKNYAQLRRIAEDYGTSILRTPYRRG